MEVDEESTPIKMEDTTSQALEVKGNGNLKRKYQDETSDDENEFLGFDKAEITVGNHIIQDIKKSFTDSSSDETTLKRQGQQQLTRSEIMDPAFKLPFKYGWKRELVLRAEPVMSKEKGEVYYITPSGKKLRTRHEIQNHLHDDLTINNFTLVKEAIGAGPEDEIIRSAKYYNYSRRSAVDPVINEATPPPVLGKRVPKPKMPKGASPPPSNIHGTPTTPVASASLITCNNKSIIMKENQLDVNKTSPIRKQITVKGKTKGDPHCGINCLPALGKIPKLKCIVCLCLYHHECTKRSLDSTTVSGAFICENCISKQNQKLPIKNPSKYHQQLQQQEQHNFERNPQALVTYNGKKFIMFESDESNDGPASKVTVSRSRSIIQKPNPETGLKAALSVSRSQSIAENPSATNDSNISPFNFSSNFLRNVSTGFEVLLHTFQYLKVQELQRASRVCRMWNLIANSSILWRTVRMKNSHVNDWDGFVRTLQRNGTTHLDLRKVLMGNEQESWKEFSEHIGKIHQLQGIDLCRCQSKIVEELFRSNPNLRVINALSLKEENIDLEALQEHPNTLEELRLRTVHANGLKVLNLNFSVLLKIRHLSLTTLENLHLIFNDSQLLRELTALESLELGNCDQLSDEQFAENLSYLKKLQRLRIEKGSQSFNINFVLKTIAQKLGNLVQLELINCDIKKVTEDNSFDVDIQKCVNLRKLLLIPTYVSQSAATNSMIMKGVMTLKDLDTMHWVVTNELLRVTELYVDQWDSKVEKGKKSPEKQINSGASSPVKASDCIPILKPVPGSDEDTPEARAGSNVVQQVEIVMLKKVETILSKTLSATKVKLRKIPQQHTWRLTFSEDGK